MGRILDYPEKPSPGLNDYLLVDSSSEGTKKISASNIVTVDSSLTQPGQPADAKKTGDEIASIKTDLYNIPTVDPTLTQSGQAADSKAVGDALANKVDKITGKGLSTEDYTTAEKTKLEGLTQIEVDDTLSVEGRAADAKAVGNEITILNEEIGNIYTKHYDHIVSPLAYVANDGEDNVSLSYSGNGFTATLVSSANATYGFSFPTEVGSHYNVDIDVANGSIYTLSAVKGTSFSNTIYLDRKTNVPVGKTTLSFDAVTSTTTIWFYQRYNVPSITINDISIALGWSYNNLDTVLTSERLPAQGKAVGDMLKSVPPASWLGYNNLFQITADDLVTDYGTVTRTISGNTITLENTVVTNAATAYKLTGIETGADYDLEFDCDTDLTASNQTAKLTTGATNSSIGNTYMALTKDGNHYSCRFKALDNVCLALPQRHDTASMTLYNIFIRKAHVVEKNTYCDYKGVDIAAFNKCLCIGDSLTYGGFNADDVDPDVGIEELARKYSYPTYLQKITGIEVDKIATGGITSVDWWNAHKNDDLSGYDIAIIQLGVNDGSPSRYGGWTQNSIDAFTNIIAKLKSDNKGIKIFVATTINAPAYMDRYRREVSEGIRQLIEDLDDTDVVLADMNLYGHLDDSVAYNAGHLTAYGYYRLAKDYIALISYLISQNKEHYRFIQFIGTNYHYSN